MIGSNVFHCQVHVYCLVREAADTPCVKERLEKTLQNYGILPIQHNGHQMTEDERYLEYGFEHRVTAQKGRLKILKYWKFLHHCKTLDHEKAMKKLETRMNRFLWTKKLAFRNSWAWSTPWSAHETWNHFPLETYRPGKYYESEF